MIKKLFDTKTDIRLRLFYVLAGTSCLANMLGFLSNVIFYGFTKETVLCGVCAVIMFFLATAGGKYNASIAIKIILLIINVIEFPFMCYLHGASRVVYMILGIFGIVVFLEKGRRVACAVLVVVMDIGVFVMARLYPPAAYKVDAGGELGALIMSFVIVVACIVAIVLVVVTQYENQTSELRSMAQELKDMANLDPLTHLYNRRYLTQYLEKLVEGNAVFAVALLDLDDFKAVNDNYGHLYGDAILIHFAQAMKEYVTEGIAARFGGEEFMIVFQPYNRENANAVLERIQEDIGEYSMKTQGFSLSFSGGVEMYRKEDRITKLFNSADAKLYEAKRTGKNRVVF